ncbi:hypothetical protein ACCO45_007958 [Purpureocillium lilacinum]|uniref:Uncharacterized protein n=1 Tax=Purpureocillium lilacinum TaxID=33203 RepID=A0ACC4DQ08_PURLI
MSGARRMPSSPLPASLLVTDHILDLFAHAVTWADKVLDAGPTAPPSGQGHAQEPASHCGFWLFLRPGLLPLFILPQRLYPPIYLRHIAVMNLPASVSRNPRTWRGPEWRFRESAFWNYCRPPEGGWWQAGMAAPGPPSRTPPTPMQALGCNLHVRGRENPGSAWAVQYCTVQT